MAARFHREHAKNGRVQFRIDLSSAPSLAAHRHLVELPKREQQVINMLDGMI